MNEPLFPITLLILALPVLAGMIYGMTRLGQLEDRVWAFGAAAAVMISLAAIALRVFQVPAQLWNVDRLAVTISMFKGYRLYYLPNEGPIESHLYGPFAAITYLPAAIAHTPTNALLIAALIAAIWFNLPAAWLICRSTGASWIARVAAIACFGFLVQNNRCMEHASATNHADAPALGLIACAAAALMVNDVPGELGMPTGRFVLSSIFAVLAVWTKQTAAPIVVVLPLWVALCDGWRIAAKYLSVLATVGIAVSTICFCAFGPRAVWFNMFVEPAGHPWQFDPHNHLNAFLHVLKMLSQACIPSAIILVASVALRTPPKNARTFVDRHRWLLPLMISLAMVPTACLGWVKQGGESNNGAYTVYFLLIAACSALADCEMPRFLPADRAPSHWMRAILVAFALVLAVLMYNNDDQYYVQRRIALHVHDNLAEMDYRCSLEYPEEIYFPWDPLAGLLASGKLYHFDYGVHDRILAGLSPTKEHIHAYLPEHMRYLVYGPYSYPSMDMMTELPEFNQRISVEGLSGYEVFSRSDDRPAQ